MDLVVIESPFAGKSTLPWILGIIHRWILRMRNIQYARACVRDALMRNEAPIASHLLYTQRGILDDDIRSEREHGIRAGFAWGRLATKRVFYCDLGFSAGMRWGQEEAKRLNQTIEYRCLYQNPEAYGEKN